jgi:hypothetical protein
MPAAVLTMDRSRQRAANPGFSLNYKLWTALQVKSKEKPDYRFYLPYDKMYRKDVLAYAYQRCKTNNGAPEIDGQDFRILVC